MRTEPVPPHEPPAAATAAAPIADAASPRDDLPGRSAPAGTPPAVGAPKLHAPLFAPTPPQPIASFVAGVVEPIVSVGTLMATALWLHSSIDRAIELLALGVMVLTFPGANRFHASTRDAIGGIVAAWATVVGVMALVGYATDTLQYFDTRVLATWTVVTPVMHFALALLGRLGLRQRARQPEYRRAALVIGASDLGLRVAAMLRRRSAVGHDFVGFIEDRDPARCPAATHPDIIGRMDAVRQIMAERHIRDVYLTLPLGAQPRIRRLLTELQDSAASLYFVPDVFTTTIIQGRMRNFDGVPVVGLLESPFVGTNALVKRASDLVLGSLILLLVAPVMVAVAIGVKLSSPGPVIFRQRRHGLDGREIVVYKFRSMTTLDNGDVIRQATRHDPRITRFGAFLRRTSLDELPQFINVLQGRMSIVGPRPHALAHNEQYRQQVNAYMLRHKVRPGVTGWAQVNGSRGETDTHEKMAERVRLDLEYLRHWSLGLDLRIIARTAALTLFDRNAY